MGEHDVQKALEYAGAFLIAAAAGVLKYLQRFTQIPKPPFDWPVFVIQVGTAVFAGKVADWLFWDANPSLSKAAVALAGWGGAEFIAWAERKVRGTSQPS